MRKTRPIHSETVGGHGRSHERRDTHPAFGVATVTRGQGSGTSLFQSDLLHNQTITLAIHEADRTRTLNRDWVHSGKSIVEVEMSLAQWGALVSAVGLGSGVPVTIRQRMGEPLVPEIPYEPRIAENLSEVNGSVERMLRESQDTLAGLTKAIEAKQGVKAIREALRKHQVTLNNASANAEFVVKSVAEAAEKVTSQAKADIESHMLAAAQQTGMTAPVEFPVIDSFVAGDDDTAAQTAVGGQ